MEGVHGWAINPMYLKHKLNFIDNYFVYKSENKIQSFCCPQNVWGGFHW